MDQPLFFASKHSFGLVSLVKPLAMESKPEPRMCLRSHFSRSVIAHLSDYGYESLNMHTLINTVIFRHPVRLLPGRACLHTVSELAARRNCGENGGCKATFSSKRSSSADTNRDVPINTVIEPCLLYIIKKYAILTKDPYGI